MPTRGYGSHVPNPGPLAAGGHVMADSVRVTSMSTPITHPEHVKPCSRWDQPGPGGSTAARDR